MKVTIEEFVKDRHDDFCTEHSVGAVLFDQGFINSVYRETALNLNCEDGFYESSDLFKIWNKLESLPHSSSNFKGWQSQRNSSSSEDELR